MLARPLTASALVERLLRNQLATTIPRLEANVTRLGRSFGRHTVG
jgi:hypothetical protein